MAHEESGNGYVRRFAFWVITSLITLLGTLCFAWHSRDINRLEMAVIETRLTTNEHEGFLREVKKDIEFIRQQQDEHKAILKEINGKLSR